MPALLGVPALAVFIYKVKTGKGLLRVQNGQGRRDHRGLVGRGCSGTSLQFADGKISQTARLKRGSSPYRIIPYHKRAAAFYLLAEISAAPRNDPGLG